MSYLIDRIYQKVRTFVNTELRGNVTPSEFNLLLHDAIQQRTEEYIFDINRATNRQNRGLSTNFIANIPDRLYEKVNHYLVNDLQMAKTDDTTFVIPDDCKYIDGFEGDDGTIFEHCNNKKELVILKAAATSQYPICHTYTNVLKVFPEFSGQINMTYWRKINYPKWTYQLVGSVEVFDPTANGFVDADIHPSEENEIVRRVLMRFGINLKENDIVQFTLQDDAKEFNQSNAN